MPLQNPPWDLTSAQGREGAREAQREQWRQYAANKAETMNRTPVCVFGNTGHQLCEASLWECLCTCHDPQEVDNSQPAP